MSEFFAELSWQSFGWRAAAVAAALALWFWTQALLGRKPVARDGIGDVVHDLTARWNRYFASHPRAANVAMAAGSVGIDLTGLALIAAALLGPTFAPFLAIIVLFGLRQISQGLCTLPPPPGIVWHDPGFPTLLVTYEVRNDYFFSGHTALAVLGAIEAARLGPPWLAVAAGLVALGEAALVLVLRAHYTMDVIAAVFAAFFAADLAERWSPVLDAWLR
jgi:hypothetical protein